MNSGMLAVKSDGHVRDFLTGEPLTSASDVSVVGGMSPLDSYERVAWTYRGISLRSRLISRFPYAWERNGEELEEAPAEVTQLDKQLARLLYRTEASLLLYGAAYWLLDSNAYGFTSPRWVLPSSVFPKIDKDQGLTHFYRPLSRPPNIDLKDIVYLWEPSLNAEIGPGIAPARVALGASSQLFAMDAFAANFFNRGAVKVTVFEVPTSMPEADKQSFQSFLNRAMSGVRQAFRNIVVRGGVKPTVVGSSVRETEAPELIGLQRDNVAVALEIPPSVIDGTAANYATAQSDYFGFIANTIVPRVEWLFESINEQYLGRFGVELVAHPERLEIMQAAQLEQAQAVNALVGKPILTLNEGRELIGYDPIDEDEIAPPAPPPGMPVRPPAPAEQEGEDMEQEDMVGALASWRAQHLEALRAGTFYSPAPYRSRVPRDVYARLVAALEDAKTTRAVRRAFSDNWPTGATRARDMRDMDRLADAIEAATKALGAQNATATATIPDVHVSMPEIRVDVQPPAQAIPEIKPVFNVPAPVVNVTTPAPIVNVNVPAPIVTNDVQTPNVIIAQPAPRRRITLERDPDGRLAGATVSE